MTMTHEEMEQELIRMNAELKKLHDEQAKILGLA